MRHIVFLAALFGTLQAVTLAELETLPESRAKNFQIWQYFDQNITSSQADEAFYQIKDVNTKMFLAYAKKTTKEGIAYTAQCMRLSTDAFATTDDVNCLRIAMSPYRFAKLSHHQKKRIAKKLSHFEEFSWMEVLVDKNIKRNYALYGSTDFLKAYNGCGSSYRQTHFNFPIHRDYLVKLDDENAFAQFVKLSVTDKTMTQINHSLLALQNYNVYYYSAFLLGLNALKHGDKAQALEYFKKVYRSAYYRTDKNKALFWSYLASKDSSYYRELALSSDIDIYSLLAKEKYNISIENVVTTLPTSNMARAYNIEDPFVWNEIDTAIKNSSKEELKELQGKYSNPKLLPVQAMIYARLNGYKEHVYLTPYQEALEGLDVHQKAMFYALMRQESHYIPAALSRSFALGLMQMMPFLVEDIAKKNRYTLKNLDEMFEPSLNIKFARIHMRYLEKYLMHPLFIAYAYNGGIGYTKKLITGELFTKGEYEPYLSMELNAYDETREYGKKVLANYIIYMKIFNKEVSPAHLIHTLFEPGETDRFRHQKSQSGW